MTKGIFFSFSFLLFSISAYGSTNHSLIIQKMLGFQLDQSKEWLNLLHYKKNFFYGHTAQADTPTFFFNKEGKYSPRKEFVSSLQAILAPLKTTSDKHAQCRFPARTLFFKQHLKDHQHLFNINCPQYNKFRKKLSAKSVSIIFSSYYLDNPSSSFGHTFMKFSKVKNPKEGENFELLDYATNYSANVTTKNAFMYAVRGMTGGFNGEFASLPYFYKVREYNDFESRDLWDFQLNLTPEEIIKLVAHVFEMKQTYFDYFYFTENCSYHMLGLLDSVNPNWGLTEKNPTLVVPVDTIHTLFKVKGLVNKVAFRPSKMRVVKHRIGLLNKSEQEQFTKIISDFNPGKMNQSLTEKSKVKILDTTIDFIDFKYPEDIMMKQGEASKWKQALLIARSKVHYKSKKLNIPLPKSESPQLGHKSRRIGFAIGTDPFKNNIYHVEFRATLHDLLDASNGHNKNSQMEMGHLKLAFYPKDKRRNNRRSLNVDYFSLFNIISLSPVEKYFSTMSWKVNLGFKKIYDTHCEFCSSPFFEIAGGFSYKYLNILFFSFIKTEIEISKDFRQRGYRLGAGPETSILFQIKDNLSAMLSGDYIKRYAKKNAWTYSYSSKIRWSYFPNKSIELNYTKHQRNWKLFSKIFFHF